MVHILDEGSEFDAPIETVWKFLNSPEDHGASHSDHLNPQAQPVGEAMTRMSWEQDMNGKTVKVVSRITTLPPVGLAIEVLEGPLAGSKFFNYYTPKGKKTGVAIVGEFQSAVLPPGAIEDAVRKNLEHVFSQDTATLKKFQRPK